MARGPNIDREELKTKILEVSRVIVEDGGFGALNARIIAKQIGCSVGTIYNVFQNLDDIVLHLDAQTLDDIYARMEAITHKRTDIIRIMQKMGHCYIEYGEEHYNVWNMLFEHSLPKGITPPDWYQQKIDRIFALITEVIAPLFKNKKQTICTATILWAGIHGICSLALSGSLQRVNTESPAKLADALIRNELMQVRGY